MKLGLCGMPRVGKSEVRKILVEEYGFDLLDTKAPLRWMASILTGLEYEDFISQKDKEQLYQGVQRRVIMGELGNVAEKLWGDSFMIERSFEDYPDDHNLVVDALRKDQPRDFPGYVFQVISNRGVDTGNEFDKFYKGRNDGIIINDGSFEDLRKTVDRVISKYL